MSDVPAAPLKEEQEKILSEVFLFEEKGELSAEDIDILKAMFDSPYKFVLLRRALQILTPEERGITFPGTQEFITASPSDREAYAFETAVDHRADEKVRQTLVALYRRIRQHVMNDKRAEFEAENKAEFEESKQTEEYDAQKEEGERTVGERV